MLELAEYHVPDFYKGRHFQQNLHSFNKHYHNWDRKGEGGGGWGES